MTAKPESTITDQCSRDPAAYYAGVLHVGIAVLLSPALWLFLWITLADGNDSSFFVTLAFWLYGIILLVALLLPWNMVLLRQTFRATLASVPLSAVALGCMYLLSTVLEKAAKQRLGSGVRAYFQSVFISIDYIFITFQLCCLIPVLCFAVLMLLRRYWKLSPALLFAVANLPFWIAIVVVYSMKWVVW